MQFFTHTFLEKPQFSKNQFLLRKPTNSSDEAMQRFDILANKHLWNFIQDPYKHIPVFSKGMPKATEG